MSRGSRAGARSCGCRVRANGKRPVVRARDGPSISATRWIRAGRTTTTPMAMERGRRNETYPQRPTGDRLPWPGEPLGAGGDARPDVSSGAGICGIPRPGAARRMAAPGKSPIDCRRRLQGPTTGCCAAAPGSTIRTTAAPRSGTASTRPSSTPTSAFAPAVSSPQDPFLVPQALDPSALGLLAQPWLLGRSACGWRRQALDFSERSAVPSG